MYLHNFYELFASAGGAIRVPPERRIAFFEGIWVEDSVPYRSFIDIGQHQHWLTQTGGIMTDILNSLCSYVRVCR